MGLSGEGPAAPWSALAEDHRHDRDAWPIVILRDMA